MAYRRIHSLHRRLTKFSRSYGAPLHHGPLAPKKPRGKKAGRCATHRKHYDEGHPIALEAPTIGEMPKAASVEPSNPDPSVTYAPPVTAPSPGPATSVSMSDAEIAADLSDVFSGEVPSAPEPEPLVRPLSVPEPEPAPRPEPKQQSAHSIFDRMTDGQEYVTTFNLGQADFSEQFSAFEQRLQQETQEEVPVFEPSSGGYSEAQTLLGTPRRVAPLPHETMEAMAERHQVLVGMFSYWNHLALDHQGPLDANQEYIVGFEDTDSPREVSVRVTSEIKRSNALVRSYPTKDEKHNFQVPTYRMEVTGNDNQGREVTKDFEVIRYGVALGKTGTKTYETPAVVGLSDQKDYDVYAWKKRSGNRVEGYRFHNGHLLHKGAIDPTSSAWGAIGCIEVNGQNTHGEHNWELFKAYMRELTGLSEEAEIAKQKLIQVTMDQVTWADRPKLIKVKKEK